MRVVTLSIRRKAIIATVVLMTMLSALGLFIALSVAQQGKAVRAVETPAEEIAHSIVELRRTMADFKLSVVQVQQFLTDISATRGLDGLDDGPQRAADFAARAKADAEAGKAIAQTLGRDDIAAAFDAAMRDFTPYYESGKTMSAAYVAGGPEAGNPMMPRFDAASEGLQARIETLSGEINDLTMERVGRLDAALATIEDATAKLRLYLLAMSLCIAVFIVANIIYLNRAILGPVTRFQSVMHELATENYAVEVPDTARRDEIGKIASAIGTLKAKLDEARAMRAQEEERRESAANERMEALRAMANTVETETFLATSDAEDRMSDVSRELQEMAQSSQSVSRSCQDVTSMADDAGERVQSVSAAAEQLNASIAEIASQSVRASDITRQTVTLSGKAQSTIAQLSSAVDQIGAVTKLISEIAEQTNLLALNATIEAARAGTAGKGFSVVANEVKSLANQTGRATMDISAQIAEIQRTTQQAVESFAAITDAIGNVENVSSAVAAAAEEQSVTMQDIVCNIGQISDAVRNVARLIGDVAHEAHNSAARAEQMDRTCATLDQSIVEMQAAVVRALRTAVPEVDRRRARRHLLDSAVEVRVNGKTLRGHLLNCSVTGASITLPSAQFSRDTRIDVTIVGIPATVRAVVRDTRGDKFAVEFEMSESEAIAFGKGLDMLVSGGAQTAAA